MEENNVNNQEGQLYVVGTRGYSAYEVAVLNGYTGTEEEWLESLVGPQGPQGVDGRSAYQVAVDNGYIGTEEEWVNSFLTPDGYIKISEVINNLDSSSEVNPLSAKQGKILKESIDTNETAIENEISLRNTTCNNLQSQINGLTSGSPLVASSIDEMTETDKTYVNTTDGKWYYYDGDSWEIGGTYQSTGIDDYAISKYNLDSRLRDVIFKTFGSDIDISSCENDIHYIKSTSERKYVIQSASWLLAVPVQPSTTYVITKTLGGRFRAYTSVNYPANNVAITNTQSNDDGTDITITTGENDQYLGIYYYASGVDTTLTPSQILATINVYLSEAIIEQTWSNYLNNKIDNYFINLFDNNNYLNLVYYRQLGVLPRSYIAISCDDGANSLADITVDIFKGYKTTYNKNIPLTMALMKTSAIFSDSTRKAKVLDLIQNYGAGVAIHGVSSYTTYTTEGLFEFLDDQKTYLSTNLATPSSVIFPNHEFNRKTATIAGSYFGVSCTGGTDLTTNKLNTPRSNMYTLYRFSLFNENVTTDIIKEAIDYCYEHNLVFMPFFHDNALNNNYERNIELLNYCVEYANTKGLTFINIGDIPKIIR